MYIKLYIYVAWNILWNIYSRNEGSQNRVKHFLSYLLPSITILFPTFQLHRLSHWFPFAKTKHTISCRCHHHPSAGFPPMQLAHQTKPILSFLFFKQSFFSDTFLKSWWGYVPIVDFRGGRGGEHLSTSLLSKNGIPRITNDFKAI